MASAPPMHPMNDPDLLPAVDKNQLIGGCVRLPVQVDLERLREEVSRLPASYWGTRGGRVGVHQPTEGVFLRGHAPIEGPKPIEDREPLQFLPYVQSLIRESIPAPPMRCLLAKLLPHGVIRMHVDNGEYFLRTLRIHVPIVTDPSVSMFCGDRVYRMRAGETWALNNSTSHGVYSAWSEPRLHLICDFLPTAALCDLIRAGEHDLGVVDADIEERVRIGAAQ
jgi:hypothetical protein